MVSDFGIDEEIEVELNASYRVDSITEYLNFTEFWLGLNLINKAKLRPDVTANENTAYFIVYHLSQDRIFNHLVI